MNAWTIAGTLGRDAETKQGDKTSVTRFSVAVREWSNGAEATLWVNCTWFGDRGAKAARLLTKGARVAVTGRAAPRIYDGKKGPTLDAGMIVSDLTVLSAAAAPQTKRDEADEIPF